MPVRSKAQRRWLWATDPEMARRWEDHTPDDAELPEKVKKKKMKKSACTKLAEMVLDIDIGDTVLMGRFKNSPSKVTSTGTDENGQPTINGKKALTFRIKKLMPEKKK